MLYDTQWLVILIPNVLFVTCHCVFCEELSTQLLAQSCQFASVDIFCQNISWNYLRKLRKLQKIQLGGEIFSECFLTRVCLRSQIWPLLAARITSRAEGTEVDKEKEAFCSLQMAGPPPSPCPYTRPWPENLNEIENMLGRIQDRIWLLQQLSTSARLPQPYII